MITIVGMSGSLRKHSINAGLLRAAAEAVPEGCTLAIGSIKGIPLYNMDVEEAEGIPQVVTDLKDRIAAADGLLMVTPENNNSIPGVFKNALDWISRPPADRPRVFGNLPVGIMGATPGNFGTAFSQYAWLPILRVLGTQVWSGRFICSMLRMKLGPSKIKNRKSKIRLRLCRAACSVRGKDPFGVAATP